MAAEALPPPLGPLRYAPGLDEQQYRAAIPAERPSVLPRLTVLTPSFNQGDYLETTLRSVLLQGYPNLEFFVLDGGSSDHSVPILRHYESLLDSWVSKPDGGQTHAIMNGLEKATGDWFTWINSDDLLAPGALWSVARAHGDFDVLAGITHEFRGSQRVRSVDNSRLTIDDLLTDEIWHQPSIWLRPQLTRAIGLDHDLQFRFDYVLMLKYLARHPRLRLVPEALAYFRLQDTSKTMLGRVKFIEQKLAGLRRVLDDPFLASRKDRLERFAAALAWRAQLEGVAAQQDRSRWIRIREILEAVHADRQVRCTATTRRAILRLAFRGGRKRRKVGRAF